MSIQEKVTLDTAWLRQQYEENGLTLKEIGALAGCHVTTVRSRMIECEIPRRLNLMSRAQGDTSMVLRLIAERAEIDRWRRTDRRHQDTEPIYQRDKGRCWICGKKVERKNLSMDHLIPVSFDGPTEPHNLKVAHRRCNSKRGNRTPAQPFLPL